MSDKLQTVHVRINDAATGQPTPCRVRVKDARGRYRAPFGRLEKFGDQSRVEVGGNLGVAFGPWAYIDGTCEIALPPGEIRIQVAKGPEYRPIDTKLTLTPGKLSLRLAIERWADLRAEGWYSGDIRCHHLSPQGALLEGAGEDVAVINLLAWEQEARDHEGRAIPNILDFSGQRPAAEMPGHLVVVNTANEHESLGRLLLLNCHRVVHPLRFGWPLGVETWTLMDWCDQCHRKGGLVVGDHCFGWTYHGHHGELLPNVIAGRIDALDAGDLSSPAGSASERAVDLGGWYRLLDAGLRIPLVAGSAKTGNGDILGQPRTYAYLGPDNPLTYKGWIEAVRAGRTFVTRKALLSLQVNGQCPGAVLGIPRSAPVVKIRAEARSRTPFDRVEILANNQVVATAAPQGDPAGATVEAEVTMAGGWIVARCLERDRGPEDEWTSALTSPVYVEVEGQKTKPSTAAIDGLLAELQAALGWVKRHGHFEDDKQRQRLIGVFEEARATLEARRS